MKIARSIVLLSILALLAAACSPSAPTGGPGPTPAATIEMPGPTDYPADYPTSGAALPEMANAYPVLAGDENKSQGAFFAESFELRPNPNDASQTDLFVKGSLPTPCHEVRAFINPPDAGNNINVQIYSVADPEKVCTQVLSPFEGVVATIKDVPAGTYNVVSGMMQVGELVVE